MIVAVISRKGGVGKTTSVVSLAGALARLGKSVLVVDLDAQASASLSLGVSRGDLAPSVHDVLFRGMPAAKAIRSTLTAKVDLLTASADLMHADVELAPLRNREAKLRDALLPVASSYDWILLDCPASFNTIAQCALIACDHFIVPAVPHYLAFDGIQPLLEAADRLAGRYGRTSGFLGVLLTMVDNRSKSARAQATSLREKLVDRVFDCEIPMNIRLAEAPESGQTIFAWFPQAAGAHAYRLAAVELLHRTGQEPKDETAPPIAAAAVAAPAPSATAPNPPILSPPPGIPAKPLAAAGPPAHLEPAPTPLADSPGDLTAGPDLGPAPTVH
ncbi:MAG: ParA family protein [Thermoanaerobaculia bacterium]